MSWLQRSLGAGQKAGLDPTVLVEILAGSAPASRMIEGGAQHGRWHLRNADDASGHFPKGLGHHRCVRPEAGSAVVQRERRFFNSAAAAQGMGRYDTAAVISVLRNLPGAGK
jgi:hypothetical protein